MSTDTANEIIESYETGGIEGLWADFAAWAEDIEELRTLLRTAYAITE